MKHRLSHTVYDNQISTAFDIAKLSALGRSTLVISAPSNLAVPIAGAN